MFFYQNNIKQSAIFLSKTSKLLYAFRNFSSQPASLAGIQIDCAFTKIHVFSPQFFMKSCFNMIVFPKSVPCYFHIRKKFLFKFVGVQTIERGKICKYQFPNSFWAYIQTLGNARKCSSFQNVLHCK